MRTAPRQVLAAAAVALAVSAFGYRGAPAAAGFDQELGQAAPQRTGFSGQSMYRTYCATCHGPSGKGDGPFAAALRKPLPDLTQLAKSNNGVFPVERATKAIDGREVAKPHGPSDMPVWGDAFSRTTEDSDPESVRLKIEALVSHIKSIQERPAVP